MAAVRPGTRGRRNMPDLNLEEEDDWVLRPGESEADYSSRLMSTAERPSKKKQPTSTAQDEASGSGKSAMDQEVINRVDQEVKRVEESQERFFSPWKCCWRDCHEYHQKASEAYVRAHVKHHLEEQREAERLAARKERFGPWRCPWSGCRKDYMKVSETYVRAHMKKHYESRAVEQRLIAAREAESLAAREAESLAAGEAEKRQDRALSSQRKKKSQREKTSTDAQAIRAKGAHAGKPEESVTEAGTPEESVTVGSGQFSVNQEMSIPDCADDEEFLQRVLQYKFEGVEDSYMWEGADEEGRRAMVKEIQERMARTQKALLLHSQQPQGAEKPQESAINQEVIVNDKETLEQVLQAKLDLEEVPNRTIKPAADPNSMTIQDDQVDGGKSALAKETAEGEAVAFKGYVLTWERNHCKECDHFDHITVLSSMQYTHYTPGKVPFNIAETLQIFSIELKLKDHNAGGFELPLSVYGVVAVRDTLDSRKNILFSRDRDVAQELTHDDPFLHLTGPSRAILSVERVYFEIQLTVKGAAASQDKPLIACACSYNERISTLCFENIFCTLEVCLQTVEEAVQATIVGVQMVDKDELSPLTFKYGGQVACTSLPRPTARADSGGDQKIVLIESTNREMPQGDSGYVHLWRQVVSVQRGGGLDVVIQGYHKSGAVAEEGRVHFSARSCKISQQQCIVGQAEVTVTVAWSIVPTDMDDVMFNSL